MNGIYILIIRVKTAITRKIGSRGRLTFPKGSYAYVGSAQKGLDARILRHLSRKKKRFWHIDYLLTSPAVQVTHVLWRRGSKELECSVAHDIAAHGRAIRGFGCSDCCCEAHLFQIKSLTELRRAVEAA